MNYELQHKCSNVFKFKQYIPEWWKTFKEKSNISQVLTY